ncbi:TPA: chaperonin GroEL [candidate division CPR2 bacterium]|uniref:Chaperonin GroEL n=1 Tax=candidate division CPR2 bacterium GW2011_GWC1_41_48 TaxID=1618344 RepID=A0A0G0YIL6_UNCC2|nr:MAG: 60 kDa chaperonin [candidate division CPR2 bacterium GW2011_GWC2_39_35]KKR27680.1 MAG: 60 kDa chaperonin [candidate division CPR2 bacterium GW2011_GWD2_39_7]KKS09391.1 MAG: 60 kDa chaperonin [candidate division CPR2 bacterium GW2011_GWC1_41_48]OGB71756.1 MAG: chaperonin GroL [candidate division CPR2 bacterium GWD2_39_7]HBG82147.1 chaperonin GroEL [candidate division CPR2 bacterium]
MAKKIFYGDDARKRLAAGAEELTKAVATTLGPKGRNVTISKKWGAPTVTHDGVTVAKEVELTEDPKLPETLGINMGAQMVKEASSKTNDVVGDGTTTATVLAYSMIKEGFRNVTAGNNPMAMKRGMEKARDFVVEELKKRKVDIKDKQKVAEVATISAGDAAIGQLISDAVDAVGKDGVITVEKAQTMGISKEVVEGMQFDRGYISPYMITDTARMEASFENATILITDKKITAIADILPLLEKLAASGRKDLVIIAEDIEGEALATLIVNKLRGTFNTLAVKAPGYGDRRKEMLQDIATLTGGRVITEEIGLSLEAAEIDDLGEARRVTADKDNTTIIEGKGDAKDIKERIEQIRAQLKKTDSEFDREKLQERLAKLAGGVAVIKVGGATEVEVEEKKFRVDDAVAATKAALEEGIVSGGGVVLVNIAQAMEKTKDLKDAKAGDEEVIGWMIVKQALQQPFKQLMANANLNPEEKIAQINAAGKDGMGIDVNDSDKPADMTQKGIIDPVKVTRLAVENAVSVAATMITTEAIIVELPEKEAPMMPGGGGMGMDMGY